MTDRIIGTPAIVTMCGTALLLAGVSFGRDLITLAVGIYIAER